MARFLYRLGRLAYRRRWWFVAAWTAVLLAIGVSAGAFMGTLSNSFSIPGAASQQTLDRLKTELPDLAGGNGSIVYRTADGSAFTPAQAAAVQGALTRLGDLEDVASATDPFDLQSEMDSAQEKLADARLQLADGRAELADGRRQLDDGKEQLEQGRTEIEDGRTKLEEGKEEIASGTAKLQAAKAEVAAGRAELADAKKEVAAGRAKLEAGQAGVASGQGKYDAGAAQIADGTKQIAAARKTLAASDRELAAGRTQYQAGVAELTAGLGVDTLAEAEDALAAQEQQLAGLATQVEDLTKQQEALDANTSLTAEQRKETQDRLDAGKQAIAGALEVASFDQVPAALEAARAGVAEGRDGAATLKASKAKLDDGARQLAAGRKTLASKEAELAAGRKTLAASKKQLDAGADALAANRTKLDAAAARIAAGEAKLNAGAAAIAENEAKLKAGAATIAANEAKLEDGAKTLEEKAAEIPEAEQKLADGEAELADGEEELALGERKAASTAGMRFISADGTTAAANLTFTGSADALSTDARAQIKEIAAAPVGEGVEVYYSKEIVQDLSSVFGIAEVIGLAIAAAVLLAMLGTLVAAGLPLLMAVLGVGAGVGGTLALSSVIEMASITPALALMLGLAVGIDYSLFIVHRHRRQLLEGMAMEESIGRATGTSGNAVVFAGLTVVIALAALAVPGLPFLAVLGYSAAFTVAMSVVISLTLTPAVLGIIGTRLVSRRAWAKAAGAGGSRRANDDGARGWGALVTRRPWLFAVAGILLLGLVALPAASLRTALPDGSAEPEGSSALQAYELMSDRFGGGYNGPVMVVADLPAGLDADGAEAANLDLADRLRQVPGVVAAVPVDTNAANTVGVIQVIPQDGPASEATEELVHTLRDSAAQIQAETGSAIQLTGQVAIQVDVSAKLAEALPPYLGIVVGLSLILLLLVFRSVVVPLLATAGFLLSLAAAFGATVAVYQWGWLGTVFDVHTPGPIMSFLPILLTGILFGLAMDYQVFLVSGMRESYAHGRPARAAVRSGFAHAAPVVTAAALIMASVFAGFVFAHLTMMRAIGFSLAVGVLIDAFIVRMTITPAVMHLLGRHAWYIPRWLDRILPDVDVEGAKLEPAGARETERARDTVDA